MKKRRTVLPVLVGLMVLFALAVPVKAGPTVLWDQPCPNYHPNASSLYCIQQGEGRYAADDFSNVGPWNIELIHVRGFINHQGVLVNASSFNWVIYPDAGGVAGGDPSTGGELWSHSCLPGAPEVTITDIGGDWRFPEVTLDIVQAQGAPLYLPPGTYWLVFYPVVPGLTDNYMWSQASTTNLAVAQLMSPTCWYYPTMWTAWTTVYPATSSHDFAFRLEGTFPLPPPDVKYLHSTGGLFNLTDPGGTQWHEIYPVFCRTYNLTDWTDNGSKELHYCDYIWLRNKHTGEETECHVEEVAVDIVVTIEPPPVGGEAYPVNKASLLAPWIAPGVILAGGISWFVFKRWRIKT